MRLRERLRQLLHRFERALTRVEDQGVRVEQGMDNVVEQLTHLNESIYTLRSQLIEDRARRDQELTIVRQDVAVLKKKLEGASAPKH